MKILFLGIGSIAKRHIKNLREVCAERDIEITIDAFRRKAESTDGIDVVYCDEKDVPYGYDAVFVTNPTDRHLQSLRIFHDKGQHFFVEKPVVSLFQIEEARAFRTRNNTIYHIACPLRHHSVIQYIKNNIEPKDVVSVRSICSSYLPDWRPGLDYRKTYSAHKDRGGGVSIDLIHEWDYLVYLFGFPLCVKSIITRKSDLEISSDDLAVYIAEYPDKVAEIHLDYFGRKPIREIILLTNEDTIVGDLLNFQIRFLKSGEQIDFNEERDVFQKHELNCFLDMILGLNEMENEFLSGIDILELTQRNE